MENQKNKTPRFVRVLLPAGATLRPVQVIGPAFNAVQRSDEAPTTP